MLDSFWKSLDVVKLLAIVIIIAWLSAIFLKLSIDQTMTSVVMLIVGYYFGSSAGSKAKDAALLPPAAPAVPPAPPAAQ